MSWRLIMNFSKLALLSIISFSMASVSSAGSLLTKVDPKVEVPGEDSSTKQVFTCKNTVNFKNGTAVYTSSECTGQETASEETLKLVTEEGNRSNKKNINTEVIVMPHSTSLSGSESMSEG